MTFDDLKIYLSAKPGATEEFPFDATTLVLKVGGKMFAMMDTEKTPTAITLKCDLETAMALREQYPAVTPGYYMNKRHWNTVTADGTVPDEEMHGMMDESYRLVVAALPRAVRETLG